MKNKILIILLSCILLILLLTQFKLHKQYNRKNSTIEIPISIQEEIIEETKNLTEIDIINYCVQKTANILEYSFNETLLFKSSNKAHCVTYAKLCATMCNLAFKANNINSTAQCVVGYVTLYNINLCKIISQLPFKYSKYFINHDFVEIKGLNHTIFIDPCLYDLIGMDLKQIKRG